jgi:hypothetical protein
MDSVEFFKYNSIIMYIFIAEYNDDGFGGLIVNPASIPERERCADLIDETFPLAHDERPGEAVVYRHYDADGTLLYIGRAAQPRARQRVHAGFDAGTKRSWWFDRVTRIDFEWYPTPAQAAAAEIIAIEEEAPPTQKPLPLGVCE